MDLGMALMLALLLVPAAALAAWAWFAIGRVDEDLRVLRRFEGGPSRSDARATRRMPTH